MLVWGDYLLWCNFHGTSQGIKILIVHQLRHTSAITPRKKNISLRKISRIFNFVNFISNTETECLG